MSTRLHAGIERVVAAPPSKPPHSLLTAGAVARWAMAVLRAVASIVRRWTVTCGYNWIVAALPSPRRADTGQAPLVVYAVTVAESAYTGFRGQLAYMRGCGYRVVLLCSPHSGLTAYAKEENIEVAPIAMTRAWLSVTDFRALISAVRLMLRLRPALVNVCTPKASFVVGLAAWLTRVPVRIYTLWGLRLEGERMGSLRYRLLWLAERVTCASATTVLCVSNSLRSQAISIGIVRRERTQVLGRGSNNGVDVERFRPSTLINSRDARVGAGISPVAMVIGFVGRIVADKGIEILLKAFDTVAHRIDAILLLVGDYDRADPLRPELRQQIARDRRIIMTGFVDPSRWYRIMDVFVLPSRREGLANVLLEAGAAAVPTIVTRVTGCTDAIDDGRSGIVVDPEDATALANAILTLATNESMRRRLGEAGRAFVSTNFEQHQVWERIAGLYEGLGVSGRSAEPRNDRTLTPTGRRRTAFARKV